MLTACVSINERLLVEFNQYKEQLLSLSIQEVIEKSYETTMKGEIVEYVRTHPKLHYVLDMLQMDDGPLNYLYQKYLKSDSSNLFYEVAALFAELQFEWSCKTTALHKAT